MWMVSESISVGILADAAILYRKDTHRTNTRDAQVALLRNMMQDFILKSQQFFAASGQPMGVIYVAPIHNIQGEAEL